MLKNKKSKLQISLQQIPRWKILYITLLNFKDWVNNLNSIYLQTASVNLNNNYPTTFCLELCVMPSPFLML